LDAGRDAARLVFSYDYRRLDKDLQAGEAVTTGVFRQKYRLTTSRLIRPQAPRLHASIIANVRDAGVISATDDRVVLLVFLDLQSTSSLRTAPELKEPRLTMTMQRVNGRWLVAAADPF
jgi:Mce-associated membrane protein